jgi:hypothetical protein
MKTAACPPASWLAQSSPTPGDRVPLLIPQLLWVPRVGHARRALVEGCGECPPALARNSYSALEAEVAFNTAYPFCSRTFALSQSWVSLSSTQRIVRFGKYAGKEHIYGLGQERIGVRPLAQKAVEA